MSESLNGRTTDRAVDRKAAVLRAAKALERFGRTGGRHDLLEHALAAGHDPDTHKAFFWAALKAGDAKGAGDSLDALENDSGFGVDEKDRQWLQRARQALRNRRPVDTAAIIEKLRAPRQGPGIARGDRLCYLLNASLPQVASGYAMRSQHLARAMQEAGAALHCLTRPGFPGDRPGNESHDDALPSDEVDGVIYHRIPNPSRNEHKGGAYLEEAARALLAEFSRLRPKAVMAASNHVNALPGLLAARGLGIPFIYEVRGFWELSRAARTPDYAHSPEYAAELALESATAAHSDAVFTLSGPMRDELIARGVAEERIKLLPNACNPARHVPRSRDRELARHIGVPDGIPVIGYVGSFNDYEGLDDLVVACGALRRRGREFRLLLVGGETVLYPGRAPVASQLEQRAQAEGIGEWLVMPGLVPPEEVEAWYSLIDIAPFARKPLPVTELVSPMKPLEALSMAKAVVASDVAAQAEMIRHEETGLLFAKGDTAALTGALERLLADPTLRVRLGRNGRRWVLGARSWSLVARRALRWIEELTVN